MYTGSNTHADSNTNTSANTYTDAHPNPNTGTDANSRHDAYTNTNAKPNSNPVAKRERHHTSKQPRLLCRKPIASREVVNHAD